jgi:hypothetical protein
LGALGASSWVIWIHEKLLLDPLRLVHVRPINLVHLLHLRNNRNERVGGDDSTKKEAKHRKIWKTFSWTLSGLKFFNRRVITVLYVESKIAN